jgi:hypothetical protein
MGKEAMVTKLEVKSPYLSGEKEVDKKNLRIVIVYGGADKSLAL